MTRSLVCFLWITMLLLSGCGGGGEDLPELATATGTILLDEEPLVGARVSFSPQTVAKKGRGKSSSGTTNDQGQFELYYNANTKGVTPGKHTVTVSKQAGTEMEPGDEILPSKYNTKSTLTADVKAEGKNHFEYKLSSKK